MCKWGPDFQFMRFEGTPIFSSRAFKDLWALVYDCIFIMITYDLGENLVCNENNGQRK